MNNPYMSTSAIPPTIHAPGLTLSQIAERLFALAESERETSALTAIQAYQAAANILLMAQPRPLFSFGDTARGSFGESLTATSVRNETDWDDDPPEPPKRRRWWQR